MPRLHRAFALIGLLLLGQSAAAEKLRLVFDVWPPFTDDTLVNGGLATDIVSTALPVPVMPAVMSRCRGHGR